MPPIKSHVDKQKIKNARIKMRHLSQGQGKQKSKEKAEEVKTVDEIQFTPEDDNHKEEMNLKDEIV